MRLSQDPSATGLPAPGAPETPQTGPGKKGLSPLLAIFLTVFIDLVSFGLFIPDLQLRGKAMATQLLGAAATPAQIGLLTGFTLAVFSIAQLATAPFLGGLSDRIGRRKILLFTSVLTVISYLIYAHAEAYWAILLSRIFSGVAAANLGVAFAYVADVTKPEERAKGLGLIGAAFGMGFILGPVAGAFLLSANGNKPMLLGYVGATLCALNVIYIYFVLPESVTNLGSAKRSFRADFVMAMKTPGLGLLLVMFFAINFGFTNLESTFFQLLADSRSIFHLGDSARQVGGYILGLVGIVAVIMQGFVVRKITPIYGEVNLLRVAYLFYAPVFAAVPYAPLWAPAIGVIVFLGICGGLAQPSLSSLISRSAPAQIQGGIFGITQALGALARCVGPLISNPLFAFKPSAPYWLGAIVILFPALATWKLKMPEGEVAPGTLIE